MTGEESMAPSVILAAGLTPAWQQILVLDSLRPGTVNRAVEAHWCASGKVLNVGLALFHLGEPSINLAIVGGLQGEAMDTEFSATGVPHRWIRAQNPTRVCTTILERSSGVSTELVQNAEPLRAEELADFVRAYEEEVRRAHVAVLIGSLPSGTPKTFYRDLMEKTSARVVLDASGPELLEALSRKPFCVKPNREELGKTLGRNLASAAHVKEAMAEVNSLGAEWVVVSAGESALLASSNGLVLAFRPPEIKAVNPIGSGDCLAAGIASGIAGGMEMPEAIRFGVAAAVENASMLLPARLDRASVRRIAARVKMSEIQG